MTAPAFAWQTLKTGLTGPGPRSRHGLAYDRDAKAVVLFGGLVWAERGRPPAGAGEGAWLNFGKGLRGQIPADTWEFRDGEWVTVLDDARPPGRQRGAMAFDDGRGFAVLFGGQGARGVLFGDTWTYARGRWQKRRGWSWRRPAPRCGHALAYDPGARRVVLFGGIGLLDRSLGDTWLYDGGSWQAVRGPHPPARRYAALAYDPGLGGCVLHGGAVDDVGARQFGDAWLFRDNAWSRLPAGFETDPRDDHGLAYHHAAGRLVLLEGLGGARGLLAGGPDGWRPAPSAPPHPRFQCAPAVWADGLDGLVVHGGEARHGGPQSDATLVLRARPTPT